jgi:hypothetical protein
MPPFLDAEADGGRLEERSPAEDLSEEGPDLLHLRLPRLRLRLLVGTILSSLSSLSPM